MYYKTIIQGRLSFGQQKSYDKVIKMYEYRTETYYKGDILLQLEEVFDPVELTLSVPRYVGNATEKAFKNTVDLLEYCAQFAVAGSFHAWMIDEGNIMHKAEIEPESDKAVVMQFQKGDKLFRLQGNDEEALKAFSETIEKYDKHAQAYERRGWVNLRLRNYSDALYDFNKAIRLDDSIAFAYYGKGHILQSEDNLVEAIECYEETLKKSVALQSLYWRARLRKAECHIELKQWEPALFDLKFFTKRNFQRDDSNLQRRPRAFALFGKALYESGDFESALQNLDKALQMSTPETKEYDRQEALYYRALSKKALGKKDFKSDLLEASEQGHHLANELLAQLS